MGRTRTVRELTSTWWSNPTGRADTGRHSRRPTPSGECRHRHVLCHCRRLHGRWHRLCGRTSWSAGNGRMLRGCPWVLTPASIATSSGSHRSLRQPRLSSPHHRVPGLRVSDAGLPRSSIPVMSDVDVWMSTELTPSPRPSSLQAMHERLSTDAMIRMHGMQICRKLEAEQSGRPTTGQAQVPHAAQQGYAGGCSQEAGGGQARRQERHAATHSYEPTTSAGESVGGEHRSGRQGIAEQPRAAAAAAGSDQARVQSGGRGWAGTAAGAAGSIHSYEPETSGWRKCGRRARGAVGRGLPSSRGRLRRLRGRIGPGAVRRQGVGRHGGRSGRQRHTAMSQSIWLAKVWAASTRSGRQGIAEQPRAAAAAAGSDQARVQSGGRGWAGTAAGAAGSDTQL